MRSRAAGSASSALTAAPSSRASCTIACGAAHGEQARHFRAVEVMRAGQDRDAERCGLEQVVAADRHQAPADEGQVRRRIEVEQLPERIEQQHRDPGRLGVVRGGRGLRAARPGHTAHSQLTGYLGEARRMARRQHQQRSRVPLTHAPVRLERGCFLAGVRAAGDPQRRLRHVLRAQPRAARRDVRRQLEIEFQVAGDVQCCRGSAPRARKRSASPSPWAATTAACDSAPLKSAPRRR